MVWAGAWDAGAPTDPRQHCASSRADSARNPSLLGCLRQVTAPLWTLDPLSVKLRGRDPASLPGLQDCAVIARGPRPGWVHGYW